MTDRGDRRHRAGSERANQALVAEREQVLEAAAAAGDDDDVDLGRVADRPERLDDRNRARAGPGRRSPRRGSVPAGSEAVIAVRRSRFAAASLPVTSPIRRGRRGRGRLRSAAKRPSAASFCLQPLERREVLAEPEALDREGAQSEVAAGLEELRAAEDVDALAVREVEPERVELSAGHGHAEAGAVRRDP